MSLKAPNRGGSDEGFAHAINNDTAAMSQPGVADHLSLGAAVKDPGASYAVAQGAVALLVVHVVLGNL